MFYVAICDDNPAARRALAALLRRYWDARGEACTIREFGSGAELVQHFPPETQIAFLDIEMPGLSGLEVARDLRSRFPGLYLFFVTAFAQYAIDGYAVHAFAYLKKPVQYGPLSQQLADALRELDRQKPRPVTMRQGAATVVLDCRQIYAIEVRRHTLVVSFADKKEQYPMNLNDLLPQLEQYGFLQCHRSYVVNPDFIVRFAAADLVLKNGEVIPLSKYRRKDFMREYARYKGGAGS